MRVRKAETTDAANIAAVAICVWVDTYATEGVNSDISKFVLSELVASKILNIIETKEVYVVANDDRLLGYMVLGPEENHEVELETIYVLPRFHGHGIGKALILEALQNVSTVLWLSVWEENDHAITFYKKLGFIESGELDFDLYGQKIRNIVFKIGAP